MISAKLRIGIVGAGTTGLYLANLLIQQGHQVDVFERSPRPRTEGCGILLIQAGIEALHQGNPQLCQNVIHRGAFIKTFEYRNLHDQQIRSESVAAADSALPRILMIHRGEILKALLESVPTKQIHGQAQFRAAVQSEQSIIAHFTDGHTWQGDLLIGADGIASSVRDFVVPGVRPAYLGDIVWRGIGRDRDFCPEGRYILYVRSRGIYTNFCSLGNGWVHWGFFLEKAQKPSERGTPRPGNTAMPRAELAKLPDAPRALIEATPPAQRVCHFSYDIDPLPRLYSGRILLLGDAAHAKSPTRAQGMTAGFEDALALSQHLAVREEVDQALQAFQAERLPVVQEYQRTSRDLSRKIGRLHRQSA